MDQDSGKADKDLGVQRGKLPKTRRFPLRVVLTVTTGRLLTERKGPMDNGIGDLYELLNWITGDGLYTHQLGRASEAARPWLFKCFPELTGVNDTLHLLDGWLSTGEPQQAIQRWLTEIKLNAPDLKNEYDIAPIPDGWVSIDPLLELESRVGKERVITVNVPE